jgi:3-oxoacyl-[acyl-carrier protein] reductase
MGVVADIEKMFDLALSNHGQLDILVNNAGVATYKTIADFSEQEYDRIFDINVKGLFFCCQQAARKMADNGCVINIGSTVTRVMLPTYGAYAATKGAVEQITKVLAKELGDRGIRVNTLSPGPVDTSLFRAGKTSEQVEQMASMAALNRIGTVDDIANMVALLVDDRSGWVTGQNILINGGFAA